MGAGWTAVKDFAAGIPLVGGMVRAAIDYFDGTYAQQEKEITKQDLLDQWERELSARQITIDAATADALDHIAAALTNNDLKSAQNQLEYLKSDVNHYISGPQREAMHKAVAEQEQKVHDLTLAEDSKQQSTSNADKVQDLSITPQ